jgi:hypothetical protein
VTGSSEGKESSWLIEKEKQSKDCTRLNLLVGWCSHLAERRIPCRRLRQQCAHLKLAANEDFPPANSNEGSTARCPSTRRLPSHRCSKPHHRSPRRPNRSATRHRKIQTNHIRREIDRLFQKVLSAGRSFEIITLRLIITRVWTLRRIISII